MLRRPLLALLLLSVAVPIAGASAESYTTRIEPRPYYGSIVTVEQGVRVWRPVPPTRHMIINPTGAPVSVNVTDVRETINHNHNGMPLAYGAPAPIIGDGPGAYYGPYLYGRGYGAHRHRAGALGRPRAVLRHARPGHRPR